jgi:hypothetical protein
MTKKPIANPFALLIWPNRYILDEQMTSLGVAIAPILLQEARRPGLHDHLYQRMQLSTNFVKVDEMPHNRLIVIGGHWDRFVSDKKDPFGIRCPG